jgi:hypothetical protein
MMDVVTEYAKKWRFEVNRGKSQVVVYGAGNKGWWDRKWMLGGGELKHVEGYTYLGMEMQRKRGWAVYKKRMIMKARRVFGLVKVMCRRNQWMSMKVKNMLWKGLMRPVMEYGSEVWGGKKWEEAEMMQRKVGRMLLGVKKNTPGAMIRGDLGWLQMWQRRVKLRIRYWKKITDMPKGRLTKIAYI